ncbi:MAG: GntR family transcriptional regulator [Cytophagales bacterium]|nr:GntR family transcriptional regulator [Cytophagales bacterium]
MILEKKRNNPFYDMEECVNGSKSNHIVRHLISAINSGCIKVNDKLPSINEFLSENCNYSRPTVIRAYQKLKEKKIIESIHGKGFYIYKAEKKEVLLIFKQLSYKEKEIYDSLSKILKRSANIRLLIHENNPDSFINFIKQANEFSYFVVFHSSFNDNYYEQHIRNKIPPNKLILLDSKLDNNDEIIAGVYQNMEKNIFSALKQLYPLLKKYKKIIVVHEEKETALKEIVLGFEKFCSAHSIDFQFGHEVNSIPINKETVYINFQQKVLAELIKRIKDSKFKIGKEIGIISYNETPLNDILLEGITAITTDYEKMGQQAAYMIMNDQSLRLDNSFYVIPRKSV